MTFKAEGGGFFSHSEAEILSDLQFHFELFAGALPRLGVPWYGDPYRDYQLHHNLS